MVGSPGDLVPKPAHRVIGYQLSVTSRESEVGSTLLRPPTILAVWPSCRLASCIEAPADYRRGSERCANVDCLRAARSGLRLITLGPTAALALPIAALAVSL